MKYEDFDGVLFDMDGTILDSMPWWRRLRIDYLASLGVELTPRIRDLLIEDPRNSEVDEYLRERDVDETSDEIRDLMLQVMRSHYLYRVEPRPFVREFIDALRQRGKRLCVATVTPASMSVPALDRHHLLDSMEFLISAKDEGLSKADPQFYHLAARQLGIAPGRCVMVEDSLYAAEAARAAGLHVWGIEEPVQRLTQDQLKSVCDLYGKSFPELLAKLD